MRAALAAIRAEVPDLPEVREILAFIQTTRRGVISGARRPSSTSRLESPKPGDLETN
jgi:hypothetical protein